MSADGGPRRRGAAGADGGDRVGGRRLEGVDGAMRAGASVARVVRDLEKRRVKGEARRGSRLAWGKAEVEREIRCQTVSLSAGVSQSRCVGRPTWTWRRPVKQCVRRITD